MKNKNFWHISRTTSFFGWLIRFDYLLSIFYQFYFQLFVHTKNVFCIVVWVQPIILLIYSKWTSVASINRHSPLACFTFSFIKKQQRATKNSHLFGWLIILKPVLIRWVDFSIIVWQKTFMVLKERQKIIKKN